MKGFATEFVLYSSSGSEEVARETTATDFEEHALRPGVRARQLEVKWVQVECFLSVLRVVKCSVR